MGPITRLTSFVAALVLTAPLVVTAQQATKVYRIGLLSSGASPSPTSPASPFREGLYELGFADGGNVMLESRYAEFKQERLPHLADGWSDSRWT